MQKFIESNVKRLKLNRENRHDKRTIRNILMPIRKSKKKRPFREKKIYFDLADQGICPFTDVEGKRQICLQEKGVDLSKVTATDQQQELLLLTRPKFVARREKQRFIVKCIVQDIKLKGEDPVAYLESNMYKTTEIFDYQDGKLDAIIARYKAIISERGSLSGIMAENPFDASVAIYGVHAKDSIQDASKATTEAKAAAKVEATRLKGEAKEEKQKEKAAAKADNARIKAEAKSAQDAIKAEAKAAKEAAKAEAKAAKEAAKTEAIVAEENELNAAEKITEVATAEKSEVDNIELNALDESNVAIAGVIDDEDQSVVAVVTKNSRRLPVAPIVTVLGGGVAFKVWKYKAADAEDERQRQFKLLMGMDENEDDEDDDDDDDNDNVEDDDNEDNAADDLDMTSPTEVQDEGFPKAGKTPKTAPVAAPKKRRMGLSSVFSKKNTNDRETVLTKLMEPSATAPEFATLLAKILSFGARGRFPEIENLPNAVPMEEFNLEKAKDILIDSRGDLGLTDKISAEIFASVVNCMIIDIIDLASSSIGGKDIKKDATVNGLNIVMDFMDHAASLFDSVAAGVEINPVTYGGNLGKKKLEQMYTIYGSSTMTSLDGSVTQDRVDTLQQVFNINDKKAEGLIQKGMLKNLMSMMKDGGGEGLEGMEGMEGMEGLAELMGGGDGLEGVPGFGEGDISEEDLKQSVDMMKELVESGNVSKDELDLVRQQFKDLYGSDINELITAADEEGAGEELGEDGKELLDLFKTILKEDDE